MATKIKYISASEFLEVTPEGIINLATSRQLLVDIAKAERPPADHELLVDFRDAHGQLSTSDVYQLAGELCLHGHTFRRKVALLVVPGVNFERASFFETCSHNRGFSVNAFTDYEKAMRWVLSAEELPVKEDLPVKKNIPVKNVPSGKGGRKRRPIAAPAPRRPAKDKKCKRA